MKKTIKTTNGKITVDTTKAETIWELDFNDNLYENCYDGSAGVYKQDNTYFVAISHRNAFAYNGSDFAFLLNVEATKRALSLESNEDKWEFINNMKEYATWTASER